MKTCMAAAGQGARALKVTGNAQQGGHTSPCRRRLMGCKAGLAGTDAARSGGGRRRRRAVAAAGWPWAAALTSALTPDPVQRVRRTIRAPAGAAPRLVLASDALKLAIVRNVALARLLG